MDEVFPLNRATTTGRGGVWHGFVESPGAATFALIAACVIWGTSFFFGEVALQELKVSQLLFLRFGLGSLALLPLILIRRAWLDWRDLPQFALLGFLTVPVTFLLQFEGLARTTVARASFMIGAIPPLLALASAVFLKERPGKRGWFAIAISVMGILVLTGLPGGSGSLLGDGLVFLSTMVTVAWVISNKHLIEKYSALVVTTYMFLFGTLSLAPISMMRDGVARVDISTGVLGAVLVLGLFCTALAFVLWNWGLERIPVSRAGVYLNLEPLVGAMLGFAVLREPLLPGTIVGGLLILTGAWMASHPTRDRDRRHESGSRKRGLRSAIRRDRPTSMSARSQSRMRMDRGFGSCPVLNGNMDRHVGGVHRDEGS